MCRNKFLRYILAILAVLYSGVGFFDMGDFTFLFLLLFLLILFIKYPFKIDTNFILFAFAYFIVFLLQSIIIKWISPYYYIRYFSFVLLIPYLILKLLPFNYNMQIVRFVYFLTIFDLSIWLLSIVYPAFDNYLSGLVVKLQLDPYYLKPKSMIIYTYETATALGIKRFSGFWHEPGAFAILIGYCICFNTLKKNTLISKENLIFLIALLVTFSTTAYIAIAFSLYFTLLLFLKRNTLVKIILLPIVILLSFFIYSKTEFLGEKIENQVEYQTDVSIEGTKTSGRILGLRKSINILKTYPLSGRGLSSKTEADTFSAEHHGYGWPGYFARIGIPLSILLSILFYKGLMIQARYYNADTRWVPVFLCLLVILLFSQKHTSSILFMMIFLTPIAYANRLKLILNQRTKNQSSLNNTKYLFKSND